MASILALSLRSRRESLIFAWGTGPLARLQVGQDEDAREVLFVRIGDESLGSLLSTDGDCLLTPCSRGVLH